MERWKERVYAAYISNGFGDTHKMKKEFELHRRYFKKNYLRRMPKDKHASVLELGCGMGQFLYFCQSEGYKNYTGVDVSKENIEFIKSNKILKRGGGRQVYQYPIMEFLKDKENAYDVVVLNDVIEHLTKEEIFEMMDAVIRSLKSKGIFFVKTPNMANPYVSTAGRYIDITHETGFTEASMRQVLRAAGFENISISGTDVYVLNPFVSGIARAVAKVFGFFLYLLSALYGRTSIRIFEKDLLAVGHKG